MAFPENNNILGWGRSPLFVLPLISLRQESQRVALLCG